MIMQGDALEVAKSLPDNSVHCIVTSPPYWGLRDYGTAQWEGGRGECDHRIDRAYRTLTEKTKRTPLKEETKLAGEFVPNNETCPKCGAIRKDQQLGLEPTPEEFIEKMVILFRELRRVLREDGTCWVNLGDSYSTQGGSREYGSYDGKTGRGNGIAGSRTPATGLKPKDLCGIPWRVALALQADGWYLRSDIIWSKPNPMPESVTDRPTKAHEYLFLLTKSSRYFYDAEAIKEQSHTPPGLSWEERKIMQPGKNNGVTWRNDVSQGYAGTLGNGQSRNRRTVWTIATEPYPEAHFATYPEALVEPCILAGTSAKGVCPVCGKGWERVVEKQKPPAEIYTKSKLKPDAMTRAGFANSKEENGQRGSGQKFQNWLNEHPPQTTGWQPTCNHTELPIPATVYDPFVGSGTTLAVAKRLGRNFLGSELNPDYITLAWKRINSVQPPLIVEENIVPAALYEPVQLGF